MRLHFLPYLGCIFFTLCLAGCSSVGLDMDADVSGSAASKPIHYSDARVDAMDAPLIRVPPKDGPRRAPTALLLAPRMLQPMQGGKYLAAEVGRVLWQGFLEEEVFPILEYSEHTQWTERSQALSRARARAADLAVAVEITYLLAGGTQGESALGLRLYVYDTGSGMLLWSMEHAGRMTNSPDRDFIFYQDRTRMPMEPLYAVTMALARDMARPIKAWAQPASAPSPAPLEEASRPGQIKTPQTALF